MGKMEDYLLERCEEDFWEYGEAPEPEKPLKVLVKVDRQTDKAYFATCLRKEKSGDYIALGTRWFPKSRCTLEESDFWVSELTVPSWLVKRIDILTNYSQESK